MAGKKGKSGGKRAGAGRPKEERNYSDEIKASVLKAAEKLAKEHNKPFEEAVLEMVYSDNVQDTVKCAVAKWYAEILVVKQSESRQVRENIGPTIGLPPKKNDPAKIIPIEGGKKG